MKNSSINFLKAISCMCVVFIHAKFPGPAGSLISALSRFAVMFFFMISGFYSYGEDRDKNHTKTIKKIKKIAALLIISSLFYLIWEGALVCVRSGGHALSSWLLSIFSIDNWIDFILLNRVSVSELLWFLVALIYCYLLWLAVNKLKCEKLIGAISVVILVIGITGQPVFRAFDVPIDSVIFRTAWLYGFPVFALSNRLHYYYHKRQMHIPSLLLVAGVIAGMCAVCAEWFFFGSLEYYIGTVVCTFCMFLFAVQNPDVLSNKAICFIGEKLSMYIYIIHWAVMPLVLKTAALLKFQGTFVFEWLYPIAVFVCSAIVAGFMYKLLDMSERSKN